MHHYQSATHRHEQDRKQRRFSRKLTTYRSRHINRIWPKLGALTMEFISQHCTPLFQGPGFLGPPVDFEMDPAIKPVHAPIHRQPTPKYEKIESALDTYQATGQLVRVSKPTDWVSNMVVRERDPTTTKPGKIRICLDPSQTLNKAIRQPKYIIPTFE